MIWVNFKLYPQTFAAGAVKLAKICQRVSQKTGIPIIPIVSSLDFWRVKKAISGPVWLQHLDNHFLGAATGWQSPLAAIILGASGSLLNHSEHPLPPGQVRQILAQLYRPHWQKKWYAEVPFSQLEKGFKTFQTMVCFRSKGQARRWLSHLKPRPQWFAYEPRELIGQKQSVSEVHPGTIKYLRQILPSEVPLVVGAGIHQRHDVEVARRLGAAGILVSSAVVTSSQPEKVLLDLAQGWQ